MPIIHLRKLGSIGINSDLAKETLSPIAFTSARHMSFYDGTPYKAKGYLASAFGTFTITPYSIFPAQGPSDYTWVIPGLAKVHAYYNGSLIDITRIASDYNANEATPWTGCWLNGVTFLNNSNDVPQFVGTIDGGAKLADDPAWNASWKCRALRGFKNYVIAMDVTKSGTRYPTLFKWSHPAEPGSTPPSWDETNNSYLAGEFPISVTPGRIVDGFTLKNTFIVYKTDGIIAVRETFDQDTIFRFDPISTKFGIPGVNCVTEFQPGLHAFMSQTADLMVNNGQTVYSIATKRVRNRLEVLMNSTQISRSFVITNVRMKQVWFCFAEGVNDWPNYAITWNWEENTFGEISFPPVALMAEGKYSIVQSTPRAWDDVTDESWDEQTETWDGTTANLISNRILAISPQNDESYVMSEGYSAAGANIFSRLERLTMPLAAQDEAGEPTIDPKIVKLVTRVFPLIEAPQGGTFDIQVGMQDHAAGRITWQGPFTFDPATDEYIEFFCEGRFISYRVDNTSGKPWRLVGMDFDIVLNGEYF